MSTSSSQAVGPSAVGPDAAFSEAKKAFLGSISADERAQFRQYKSAKDLIDSMAALSQGYDRSSFRKMMKSVEAFAKWIEPYFPVIGIFTQINPEWASVAYGSLRLVLQLASNYTSFFEKLVSFLDVVKGNLPRFDDLLKLMETETEHKASQRLQQTIQSFYLDLFELFQAIAGIFTRKSGKIIHRAREAVKMCWQPFNVRFESILARLAMHQKVVHDEIEIFNTAKLVTICQLELEQLVIAKDNASALKDLQQENSDLQRKIDKYSELQKEKEKKILGYQGSLIQAKQNDANLLRDALRDYAQQIDLVKQMQSEAQFASTCRDIREFINAPEFEDDYERALGERVEGTGHWLFEHPSLLDWTKKTSENVFWVNGNPGCGKTILAGAAVSEMAAIMLGGDPFVAYYFFSGSHQKTTKANTEIRSAYRAFLAQIFSAESANEPLTSAITFEMRSSAQGTASRAGLKDLLRLAANCVSNLLFIVDAIDECEDPDEFVDEFIDLFRGTQVKILLFSRLTVQALHLRVEPEFRITLGKLSNRDDIHKYCTLRINRLVRAKLLPAKIPDVTELADWMVTGADGMFLWARLMFIWLESRGFAPPVRAATARLDAIKRFRYPESLDSMYVRIIGSIWGSQPYERELARQVFRWIIFEKSDIPPAELHAILEFCYDSAADCQEGDTYTDEDFAAFSEMIMLACSSLVEIQQTASGPRYRFIHLSAFEFLDKRLQNVLPSAQCGAEAIQYFSICKPEAEARLTADCLKYLRHKVSAGPLSGNMLEPAQKSVVLAASPFCEYAGLNWTSHLELCLSCKHEWHSETVSELVRALSDFLSTALVLMSWVELVYLLAYNAQRQKIFRQMKMWVNWAKNHPDGSLSSMLQDLETFADDLTRMNDEWGWSLQKSPELIWQDVTAFKPSRFFLQTTATTLEPLPCNNPLLSSLSETCLCTVSEHLLDGDEMGVLGIWPSRSFHEVWDRLRDRKDLNPLQKECHGWVARYQVWDVMADDPVLKEDYVIPLEGEEVWLQVQIFLTRSSYYRDSCRGARSAWKMLSAIHFPTGIKRSDLSTFVVLRTVYTIERDPDPTPSVPHYKSHRLPLDFNKNLLSIWGQGNSSTSCAHVVPGKYAYGVQFSEHGTYVLYWDVSDISELPKKNHDVATTLAVFQLDSSVRLLGHLETGNPQTQSWRDDVFGGWKFHPTLPVLVLKVFYDQATWSKLMLWNFNESGMLMHGSGTSDSRERSLEKLEGFWLSGDVKFSECGMYIISQDRNNIAPPVVKSLEGSELLKHAMNTYQTTPNAATKPLQTTALTVTNPSGAQALMRHDGRNISQQVVLARSGIPGVNLVRYEGDVKVTQPILALPNSITDAARVNFSVHAPRSREDKVTIVLHKATQPVYSLPRSDGFDVPVVIKKDTRAIVRPQKRKCAEICAEPEQSESEGRESKRAIKMELSEDV